MSKKKHAAAEIVTKFGGAEVFLAKTQNISKIYRPQWITYRRYFK